ncbi:MAG: hypothetical protein ACJ8D8_10400 [Microvirga sp.]|jgi:hypothetical protein|nr:hypothetical protein [Beijerinckiaceae bacterium]
MLVLLRIVLTVGVLYWYSPLRAPSPWEKPGEARPAASQEGPHGFGPSSFERVGRVIRAWEMLPDRTGTRCCGASSGPCRRSPHRESRPIRAR